MWGVMEQRQILLNCLRLQRHLNTVLLKLQPNTKVFHQNVEDENYRISKDPTSWVTITGNPNFIGEFRDGLGPDITTAGKATLDIAYTITDDKSDIPLTIQ